MGILSFQTANYADCSRLECGPDKLGEVYQNVFLCSEDGRRTTLRNFYIYLPRYTASRPTG